MVLDYVIKNDKDVYIRLNSEGQPITCSKNDKTLFEYTKAKNILGSLPKVLRRYCFKCEPLSDFRKDQKELGEHSIAKENYQVPDEVKQWVEKFGICDDILKEAQKRKDELWQELSNVDRQFSNMVHKIEFTESINMYGAWLERKELKKNRDKRRKIKDELSIISNVLQMDFRNIDREKINKMVFGLANRKFKFRVVEEEESENVM